MSIKYNKKCQGSRQNLILRGRDISLTARKINFDYNALSDWLKTKKKNLMNNIACVKVRLAKKTQRFA